MADENVVLVTFEESKAYQAATVLKEASAEGRVDLHAVAVMRGWKTAPLGSKKATPTTSRQAPGPGSSAERPAGSWG